jgi:hypothetical protein
MKDHWFWWTMMMAVLVWYSTVTVYVAVRGIWDIRGMLQRLAQRHADSPDDQDGGKPPSPP